ILSRPSKELSSHSNEIDNTIAVGNAIGFGMTGKQNDIQNIFTNETMSGDLKSMWNNSEFDFAIKNSVGNSEGIVAMWDVTYFSRSASWEGEGVPSSFG
ncbi:hypothetical protein Tco_1074127, partial [Tanacetum coccineum]